MALSSSSSGDEDAIVGINVTPLVDIILVLLIIFMVTARIMVSQSVPMDLPKAASGEEVQTVFSIELHANGDTFVDSKKVASDDVLRQLAREGYEKNNELRAVIKADSSVSHGRVIHVLDLLKREVPDLEITVTPDPAQAVRDAVAVYTDIWASMGQEDESEQRRRDFQDYQVNAGLMSHAQKGAVFMHCMPARRGEEVTDEVIDGPQSVVVQQAANRMHVQKGILTWLLGAKA